MTPTTRHIAIDPGTTTGVCMLEVTGNYIHDPFMTQLKPIQRVAEFIRDMLGPGVDTIALETFHIGDKTHGASRAGLEDALNLIGWINIEFGSIYHMNTKVVHQSPSLGKTIDDAILKAIGWYTPGKRHQNDAGLHMVRYLLNQKHPKMREMYRQAAHGEHHN